MIFIIPHIALSVILALFLIDYWGWETTAIRLFLVSFLFYSILWPVSWLINKRYFHKLPKLMNLIVYFIYELILANIRVAYDVVTPTTHMRPCIVALPLEAKTDLEITILANMISLTPGTLSLDLSEDRKYLFVHAIYFKQVTAEKIKYDLKNGFEKRLLEVMR